MDIARYSFPTLIHAGPGARAALPAVLKARGVEAPLIVTDRNLATLPLIDDLQGLLARNGLAAKVFSGIGGNPVASQVTAGVQAYREQRHDGLVAVGGGAALDVAKAMALMAEHPGDLFDYEDGKPDARPVDRPIPCLVALPTTAGTGSEVGRSAVISDDATKTKKIIYDPKLLPVEVFADAELTVELPAALTASTGMDALSHLLEAFLSKGHHPMCDGIALQGLRLVQESLVAAVEFAKQGVGATPTHLAARADMLDAAMMGAVAFQKGLGVTHSCAHALSAVCDMHHGLANGVLLPYTMAFNDQAVPERVRIVAETLRLEEATGDAFVAWLRQLQQRTGTPATLSEVGVTADQVPDLVRLSLADGCHQCNPRQVSERDFRELFERALG